MHIFSADLLVIGGGGAGIAAAVAARQLGKKVLVVSKFGPGFATCTTVSNSSFRNSGSNFTKEEHRSLSLETGQGLNEKELVEVLVEKGEADVKDLRQMGVPIEEKYGGSFCKGKVPFFRGPAVIKPITDFARSLGVEFIQPYLIWDLVLEDGEIKGAWGIDRNSEEPALFLAPTTILATGGAGALYQRTDTPNSITGDGYAMAARAGLPLIDMEFVQFYPYYTAFGYTERKESFIPPVVGEVASLVNEEGEDIVEKYKIARPLAVKSRDLSCRAMMLEGKAFFDFTNVTENKWQEAGKLFDANNTVQAKEWLENRFLHTTKKIPVLPTAHFFMGGVPADSWGQTEKEGLYVAGEVMGGLHGANRLEGNALTEIFVFGKRAGLAAAKDIKELNSFPLQEKVLKKLEPQIKNLLTAPLDSNTYEPEIIRNKLAKLMWEKAGIIRDKVGLEETLTQVQAMQKLPLSLTAGKAKALEVKNMLLVAEIIIKAALFRQESRGSHYRLDYQERNDQEWKCHSIVTYQEGAVKVNKLPVNL